MSMTVVIIDAVLRLVVDHCHRCVFFSPPLFLSDWLSGFNIERGTKISHSDVILYNTLFSLLLRNPRIISYSSRVDAHSPQYNVTVKLHCEHDDSSLSILVACIL